MHRASASEISLYLAVVAISTCAVCKQCFQFSSKAIPAILKAADSSALPARLSNVLDINPGHINRYHPDLQQVLRQHLPQHASKAGVVERFLDWASSVPGLQNIAASVQDFLSLPRDISDVQWREFRANLGLLALGMLAYVAVSYLARCAGHRAWRSTCLILSLAFLGVLHGKQAIWPLLLACGTFYLSHPLAGKSYGPLVMWAVQLGLLVYIRHNNGLSFGQFSPHLAWMDGHGGMLRWHIYHNLAMLRGLSYFMDMHWSRAPLPARGGKTHMAVHSATFNDLQLYCLYCFYPPLYIAGPIMTYSSWALQVASLPRVNTRQVGIYILRWLFSLTILEGMTRTLYFNAMAKHGLLTRGVLQAHGLRVEPMHYAYTGFWVLVFMWLKFLVIWRFFRAAALADGVDAPENMRRCVCNNYDVQGFWQGWHSSYNRWLVRYMYVPLGGHAWRWANVWVCFLFVALWHDLELRMLAWGLLMPAAFIPEMAIKVLGRSRALAPHAQSLWFRHVAALLGTLNVVGLMSANLVGFVVGVDGLLPLLQQVLGQPVTALIVMGVLWCAVQLMFAWREQERTWLEADDHKKAMHGE